MPALDRYHNAVRNALSKDGWAITANPLTVYVGLRRVHIDTALERLLTAEQQGRKIAVEVKSFTGLSPVADLEGAVGQIALYNAVLAEVEPDRFLYLAVPVAVYESILEEPLGLIARKHILQRIVTFDPELEEVVLWNPLP